MFDVARLSLDYKKTLCCCSSEGYKFNLLRKLEKDYVFVAPNAICLF